MGILELDTLSSLNMISYLIAVVSRSTMTHSGTQSRYCMAADITPCINSSLDKYRHTWQHTQSCLASAFFNNSAERLKSISF